jgi:hypothetical protein
VDCIIHWATDLVVIRVWVLKDGPATPIINIHDATSIKEASPLISDFKPFSKWDLNQVCSSASNFWLHKFNNNNSSTIIYHRRPAPTRLKIVLSQNPISTHVNLIQTSTWKGKKPSSSLHGCVKCQIDYANLNMNCWTCRKLIWFDHGQQSSVTDECPKTETIPPLARPTSSLLHNHTWSSRGLVF